LIYAFVYSFGPSQGMLEVLIGLLVRGFVNLVGYFSGHTQCTPCLRPKVQFSVQFLLTIVKIWMCPDHFMEILFFFPLPEGFSC